MIDFKPIPGEFLFRNVRTFRRDGVTTREPLPLQFGTKENGKPQWVAKISYRENLGMWALFSHTQHGLVAFANEEPPADWTHAVVTSVGATSATIEFLPPNRDLLMKMYPDLSTGSLGLNQLRHIAMVNAVELAQYIPTKSLILALSEFKVSEIIEIKFNNINNTIFDGFSAHLSAIASGLLDLDKQTNGSQTSRINKIKIKLNELRSDIVGLTHR